MFDRKKCCCYGKFFSENSKYPMLKPLPNYLRFISTNKIRHFNKNSAYYNTTLSIGSIGVDNGREGVGFEKINGESCVKLNGRTYFYLPRSSRKGSGINYFTFDALLDLQNAVNIFNKSMDDNNSEHHINGFYMEKIFKELQSINPFATELSRIGTDIKTIGNNNNNNINEIINLKSSINTKTHLFEIGAVISDNSIGNIIFRYKMKNCTHQISTNSEQVEPLCFPLLFPYGENGFSTKIQKEIGCYV